jgi:hypothetical protein
MVEEFMGTADPKELKEQYIKSIKKAQEITEKKLKNFKMIDLPIKTKP